MEVLVGVILAIAALVVVLAAKRGAEAVQRDRAALHAEAPSLRPSVTRPSQALLGEPVASSRQPGAGPPPTRRQPPVTAAGDPVARAGADGQSAGPVAEEPSGILARLRRPGAAVAGGAAPTGLPAPTDRAARGRLGARAATRGPTASGTRQSAARSGTAPAPGRTRPEAQSRWDTSTRPANRAPARPRRELPPIDVNAAGVEALQGLPGIGVRAAQRIVTHRERHGPFRSVGDLETVEGFDAHRVARLAPRATV